MRRINKKKTKEIKQASKQAERNTQEDISKKEIKQGEQGERTTNRERKSAGKTKGISFDSFIQPRWACQGTLEEKHTWTTNVWNIAHKAQWKDWSKQQMNGGNWRKGNLQNTNKTQKKISKEKNKLTITHEIKTDSEGDGLWSREKVKLKYENRKEHKVNKPKKKKKKTKRKKRKKQTKCEKHLCQMMPNSWIPTTVMKQLASNWFKQKRKKISKEVYRLQVVKDWQKHTLMMCCGIWKWSELKAGLTDWLTWDDMTWTTRRNWSKLSHCSTTVLPLLINMSWLFRLAAALRRSRSAREYAVAVAERVWRKNERNTTKTIKTKKGGKRWKWNMKQSQEKTRCQNKTKKKKRERIDSSCSVLEAFSLVWDSMVVMEILSFVLHKESSIQNNISHRAVMKHWHQNQDN